MNSTLHPTISKVGPVYVVARPTTTTMAPRRFETSMPTTSWTTSPPQVEVQKDIQMTTYPPVQEDNQQMMMVAGGVFCVLLIIGAGAYYFNSKKL
jgi:hypothetical protein